MRMLGTVVLDEQPLPIRDLYLRGGRLMIVVEWKPQRSLVSGSYDVMVFGPDGELFVRSYNHVKIPRDYRLGDEVRLTFDLELEDQITNQALAARR